MESVQQDNLDEKEEIKSEATVYPLPFIVDGSCTVAVSLEDGAVRQADTGAVFMDVTIYAYDMYDLVDIAELKVGEYIYLRGQVVEILSLERDAYGNLLINGGADKSGYTLHTDEDCIYYEISCNNMKCWQQYEKAVFPVSANFQFRDCAEKSTEIHTVSYLLEHISEGDFTPYNTRIVIENGEIIAMERGEIS